MKRISLSSGKYALVDDEDFEWLNQWKWSYIRTHIGGYAHRNKYIRLGVKKYKRKQVLMHRLINKTPDGLVTDHINQNKLDNRKSNLRSVTHSQNQMNTSLRKNNMLGAKGVTFQNNRYRARICIDGNSTFLGGFKSLEEAVRARQEAEKELHVIVSGT